jgi:curved DNA-binding protein CbpA
MNDAFAILGLERRPLVTAEDVEAAFLRASRKRHPDGAAAAADGGDFAELNAARGMLTNPSRRLRILLESEFPATAMRGGAISKGLMGLFGQVSNGLERAEEFLRRGEAATTALGRALLMGEMLERKAEMESVSAELTGLENTLEQHLLDLDARWLAGERGSELVEELAELGREFSFTGRWRTQVDAALARIALQEMR